MERSKRGPAVILEPRSLARYEDAPTATVAPSGPGVAGRAGMHRDEKHALLIQVIHGPRNMFNRLEGPRRNQPTLARERPSSLVVRRRRGSPCRTSLTWSVVLIARRGRYRRGTWCGRERLRSRRAGTRGVSEATSTSSVGKGTYTVLERDNDKLAALEASPEEASDVLGCCGRSQQRIS